MPRSELARVLYTIDNVICSLVREQKRPDWIDLSPKERAAAIETNGFPVGASRVRRVAWSSLSVGLDDVVEVA